MKQEKNRRSPWLRSCALVAAAMGAMLVSDRTFAQAGPDPEAVMRTKLQFLGGMGMIQGAGQLGVATVAGKDVTQAGSFPGHSSPKKLGDVGIGVHPTKHENEPTVAANPKDKKLLVAGSHFFGLPAPTTNFCVAYRSSDRGETWSAPFAMPHLSPASSCSDPVLAYAPDGGRVYYAYMDIKGAVDWDIVVSYSDDDGASWTGPIIALDAVAGFVYDKPWLATHIDEDQRNWVYVTATQFATVLGPPDNIVFTRSSNKGATWSSPPTVIDSAIFPVVVQGSRPAGGVGGEVLVAWYNSGLDGWLEGGFQIRTRRSADNGATWGPRVVAVSDSFELPFWLGPFAFYHRWWVGMMPDVEIDPGGEAHIVYTHDPAQNTLVDPFIPGFVSATAEDGDIRYISSPGPPYAFGSWSAPVTINDDGLVRAQGMPALETAHGGESSGLHAIWHDHRLGPEVPPVFPQSSNLYYDIFHSRRVPGHLDWGGNSRVSEVSSINDFVFIGDYIDLTISNKVFAVWTDRRDKATIFDFEDDVYGSQITGGGGN